MANNFKKLRDRMSPERRARAEAKTQHLLAELPLHELRRARKLSQQTLAQTMETSQGEVSKLEHRTDIYVSTLRNYVEAMNGTLRIIVEFPEGQYEINQFREIGDEVEIA